MRTKGKNSGKDRTKKAKGKKIGGIKYAPPKRYYGKPATPLSDELFRQILKHGSGIVKEGRSHESLINQVTECLRGSLRNKLVYKGPSHVVANGHCWAMTKQKAKGQEFWHGSPLASLEGLLRYGLLASRNGMLGSGVYLGTLDKAKNYAGYKNGILLKCRADLGKVHKVDTYNENIKNADIKADTIAISEGTHTGWTSLRHAEWCVRDPRRVTIIEVHVFMS